MQQPAPGDAAPNAVEPEPYYRRDGALFHPSASAASPWNPQATNGVALAGLVAVLLDEACGESALIVTRLTIDIMGAAPLAPTSGSVTFVRRGERLQMAEVRLAAGDRTVVRASAVLIRQGDCPPQAPAQTWPAPETLPRFGAFKTPELAAAIDARVITGGYREVGRGAIWIRLIRRVVDDLALTPLTRAAMLADFGSGIGSFLHAGKYSFPNVDIDLHLLRPPRGEWMVLDADTDSAGNGIALVTSAFHDQDGLFARGHQTLFVEPRSRPAQ